MRENATGAGIPVSGFTGWILRDDWLTDDEQRAIIKFHCDRPLEGCRRLTWMMTDAGIVTSSPGTRGNVLCPRGNPKDGLIVAFRSAKRTSTAPADRCRRVAWCCDGPRGVQVLQVL